jgi:hypothetical protein
MLSDADMYRNDCSTNRGLPSVAAWIPMSWTGVSGV